jgi:hypothetical protein
LLLPRLPRYHGSNYGHEAEETSLELLDTHHCQICSWISDVKGERHILSRACSYKSGDELFARELVAFLLIETQCLMARSPNCTCTFQVRFGLKLVHRSDLTTTRYNIRQPLTGPQQPHLFLSHVLLNLSFKLNIFFNRLWRSLQLSNRTQETAIAASSGLP